MTKGLLFWVIFVLCIIFWGWGRPWGGAPYVWGPVAIIFVLLFLLGWSEFGFVVR